jgi:hypothetical protein
VRPWRAGGDLDFEESLHTCADTGPECNDLSAAWRAVLRAIGISEADPQPINVKGNYTQNAGGTLLLQIAGAGSGQYNFLNVSGNANLGGILQLTNAANLASRSLGLSSRRNPFHGIWRELADR